MSEGELESGYIVWEKSLFWIKGKYKFKNACVFSIILPLLSHLTTGSLLVLSASSQLPDFIYAAESYHFSGKFFILLFYVCLLDYKLTLIKIHSSRAENFVLFGNIPWAGDIVDTQ